MLNRQKVLLWAKKACCVPLRLPIPGRASGWRSQLLPLNLCYSQWLHSSGTRTPLMDSLAWGLLFNVDESFLEVSSSFKLFLPPFSLLLQIPHVCNSPFHLFPLSFNELLDPFLGSVSRIQMCSQWMWILVLNRMTIQEEENASIELTTVSLKCVSLTVRKADINSKFKRPHGPNYLFLHLG